MRFKSGIALALSKVNYVSSNPLRAAMVVRESYRMYRATPVLQFSEEIVMRSQRRRPKFDWLLATRVPRLAVDTDESGRSKIRIDHMYLPGEEIRESTARTRPLQLR